MKVLKILGNTHTRTYMHTHASTQPPNDHFIDKIVDIHTGTRTQ